MTFMWVTEWLRNVYGLDDDDILTAGQVAEMLEQALYDYGKVVRAEMAEDISKFVKENKHKYGGGSISVDTVVDELKKHSVK